MLIFQPEGSSSLSFPGLGDTVTLGFVPKQRSQHELQFFYQLFLDVQTKLRLSLALPCQASTEPFYNRGVFGDP